MLLNGRLYETGLVGVVWIDAPQWTTETGLVGVVWIDAPQWTTVWDWAGGCRVDRCSSMDDCMRLGWWVSCG